MPDPVGAHELDRECVTFARYLIGQTPSSYAIARYRDAHTRARELARTDTTAIDRWLLAVARRQPVGARLADAYTAVLLKHALVRRKWVLLVAILESCAPTSAAFDVPGRGGRAAFAIRLLADGIAFALALGLASLVFMPVHLLSRRRIAPPRS